MNIRKYIRDVIKETYGPSMVQYSAVVIEDPAEIQKIEEIYKKVVPETGWRKSYNFHMTITLGAMPESLILRRDLNKEVELTINMIGSSDKAIALGTFGYYSKNDMPHITLAFNKKGGEPSDSKKITDWQPIPKVKVKGVIREVAHGNKILKESVGEKVVVNFEDDSIMLGPNKIGDFQLFEVRDKYLLVDKIFIDEAYRGQGYATEAMKQIISHANQQNLILALTPDNMWGSNVNKLKNWYKSLGFIMNKGKKKDFGTMQLMYKLPDSLNEIDCFGAEEPELFAFPGIPAKFPKSNEFDEFGNMIK